MKTTRFYFISIFCLVFALSTLAGCSFVQRKRPTQQSKANSVPKIASASAVRNKYQPRPRISTSRNRYEGSLWRDESSFGNLLRDHRARFRRDLLTISGLGEIITVPPPKEEVAQPADNIVQQASVVLEAFTLRDKLEEEQNEIMRSLDTMSAEVTRVLPNGNMVVRGRKIDNRQRNQVRYVTTITGILRPADVNDTNVVAANKLVYPEVKIKRQLLGSLLRSRLQQLSPLIGKQNAGLLERLSDFTKATPNR